MARVCPMQNVKNLHDIFTFCIHFNCYFRYFGKKRHYLLNLKWIDPMKILFHYMFSILRYWPSWGRFYWVTRYILLCLIMFIFSFADDPLSVKPELRHLQVKEEIREVPGYSPNIKGIEISCLYMYLFVASIIAFLCWWIKSKHFHNNRDLNLLFAV